MNRYGYKIKTVDELVSITGPRPREKKVVMCHGIFDIVHPGHIRHLLYAKEKGDLLLASLTCDEFVGKGEGRPYVPQDLRAVNLAALEMVDYVLIDPRPEPLANIAVLEPDVFVKGFEYSGSGVHPKTQQEMDMVASYGGEFLLSPGDVVYSSTQLLAHHEPPLKLAKLVTLMQAEGVTFNDLHQTLDRMRGTAVHVVGDMIVDKYTYCGLLGPSTKTPTLSVRYEESKLFVGGAGVVAKHLRSLGADVTLTTIVGGDEAATFVADDLSEWGVHLNLLCDTSRPTTVKERYWVGGYKLLQVDKVDNSPLPAKYVDEVCDLLQENRAKVVIFSDFRHGLFQSSSIHPLIDAIPHEAMKVADSQVSNRWGNILDFQGFDLITPNEHEARHALGDQDSGIRSLAYRVLAEAQAKQLILKLGDRGLLAYRRPVGEPRSFFSLDTFVQSLVDAVGAGDAMLAAVTLGLVCGGNLVQSAILGNVAAAIECASEGNVPVPNDAVHRECSALEALAGGD